MRTERALRQTRCCSTFPHVSGFQPGTVTASDRSRQRPTAPNLLNREFTASAPNPKWVTDITAIETAEGDLSSFWSGRYLLSHGSRVGYGQLAR